MRAAEIIERRYPAVGSVFPGMAPNKKTKGEKIEERIMVTYFVKMAKNILIIVPSRVKARMTLKITVRSALLVPTPSAASCRLSKKLPIKLRILTLNMTGPIGEVFLMLLKCATIMELVEK